MINPESKKTWGPRLVLIAVIALFTAPILLSWYLVFFTDYDREHGGAQHGILIDPPRQIGQLLNFEPFENDQQDIRQSWTFLSLVNGICDNLCIDSLYRMQQIRLSLGKDMNRINRMISFDSKENLNAADTIIKKYQGTDTIVLNKGDQNNFIVSGQFYPNAIYLVDPMGYLMMAYPADTEPGGIIKDLKRLLRISKVD